MHLDPAWKLKDDSGLGREGIEWKGHLYQFLSLPLLTSLVTLAVNTSHPESAPVKSYYIARLVSLYLLPLPPK